MHSTSLSLLERLRQSGDNDAWARFVDLYTPLLYYWLRREGLQPSDIEDVVQDVFLHLTRKFADFVYDKDKGRFRAWLRTVTANKLRDRRKRRTPTLLDNETRFNEPATPDEVALFTEDEYRRDLTARALQLMQAEFSPTTWKACWEHVVAGRSAPIVAAELGISPGAVYAARFRVIGRLREEFSELLD